MTISGGIFGSYRMGYLKGRQEQFFAEQVSLHLPETAPCTAEGCGYNAYTRSALNALCPVCAGRGLTYTWHVAYAPVRHSWTEPATWQLLKGVWSGAVGEVLIQGRLGDRHLFEAARDTEYAYVLLDGRRLKVLAVTVNSVEGATTIVVPCNVITDALP